jgi:methyl-accepting chemotaxis protein
VSLPRPRAGNLSLRAKIVSAVAVVVVASGAAGAFTLARLQSTGNAYQSAITEESLALQASELRSAFQVQHQKLKDIFLRGNDPASYTKYTGAFSDAATDVHSRLAVLTTELKAAGDTKSLAQIHAFNVGYAVYNASFTKAMAAVHAKTGFDFHPGDAIMSGLDKPEQDALSTLADDLAAGIGGATKSASNARALTVWLAIGALVGAALIGFAVAFLLARGISRRVAPILDRLRSLQDNCTTSLKTGLEALAGGDLSALLESGTRPIENVSKDELGAIAEAVNGIRDRTEASLEAYNGAVEHLRTLIESVAGTSTTLLDASRQMASTSEEAGRAANEIAGAVTDVASGAEKQVQMINFARTTTDETAAAAEDARQLSVEGVAAAEQADLAMRAVREATGAVTEAIRSLDAKSVQIGGIVETITGIAGQTNLLALNAAIEAARAGDQGRGFAVVAEEVRKLAEESQTAAATIATLIGEIQRETQNAVGVVEEGAQRTEDGVVVVEQTRDAFARIGQSVDDMSGRFAGIAQTMMEVAAVAESSSAGAEEVSASTEQTSASTQEIAASAQQLANTAEELARMVSVFKTTA